MKIIYEKKFLKDLAEIPLNQRKRIEDFVFNAVPKVSSFYAIGKVEKLKGFDNYYKIRFGDYRAGINFQADVLTFGRVLNRKEIYRYYP